MSKSKKGTRVLEYPVNMKDRDSSLVVCFSSRTCGHVVTAGLQRKVGDYFDSWAYADDKESWKRVKKEKPWYLKKKNIGKIAAFGDDPDEMYDEDVVVDVFRGYSGVKEGAEEYPFEAESSKWRHARVLNKIEVAK